MDGNGQLVAAPSTLVQSGTGERGKLSVRKAALLLHRYVGLAVAVFLLVAGLTGSVLAFYHELDVALAPHLYAARVHGRTKPIDALTLRDQALSRVPEGAAINIVPLDTPPGEAVNFWVDLPRALKVSGADTEYFFDTYTGQFNGSRRWGDPRQGLHGLMPFLYHLHSSLALGEVGELVLGVVALLWTLDCFAGAYLTFPPASSRTGPRTKRWLSRWLHAWRVRTGKLFSLIFSWHRASGLWLWAMLLVLAWSAVGLNLHQVYQPIMHSVYGPGKVYNLPKLKQPVQRPALSFRQAREKARALMREATHAQGVQVYSERMIRYQPAGSRYEYRVYSSRDVGERYATTTLWLDGNTGEQLDVMFPTGDGAGITLTTWINQLHFGTVGGWPYRALLVVAGLAVALLSVTGVWIWWRKRQKGTRCPEPLASSMHL
jgi:uncharacterized iron-regulated membrane protein